MNEGQLGHEAVAEGTPAPPTIAEGTTAPLTIGEETAEPGPLAESAAAPGPAPEPAPATAAGPGLAPGPPLRFRIRRRRAADPGAHWQTFEWTPRPGATMLDALLDIRRDKDPSLVVRHSCMHGSCGACGVRLDGHERLACETSVEAKPGATITVEPLRTQPLVADLAVDMADFHARMEAVAMPAVRTTEVGSKATPPEGVRAFTRFEDCTECGLCLSACPVSVADRSFIGPAALAAASRVADEPRGRELRPLFALAAEPDSVWRCSDAMQCSAVCPEAVDPAGSLLRLRRRVAFDGLKSIFRRGRSQPPTPPE